VCVCVCVCVCACVCVCPVACADCQGRAFVLRRLLTGGATGVVCALVCLWACAVPHRCYVDIDISAR
jgi:hypothetical protein